jgi:Tfp pilus assembly major pilin PilA
MRRGFSLIELLIIIGILVVLVAMSLPVYTQYLVRSDLGIAAQLINQGLARARLLAVSGQQADSWGLAASGVVFRGSNYALRDPQYDELFTIPEHVTATGITVVIFEELTGRPSQTGSIIFQSYGQQSEVFIDEHF